MRFLGIDYGTRRIGLAHGDELGIATPLPALTDAEPAKRRVALAAVVKQRRIDEIVLGYPYNMDGTAGFKAKEVDAFAESLRKEFGLPVHLVDERLAHGGGGHDAASVAGNPRAGHHRFPRGGDRAAGLFGSTFPSALAGGRGLTTDCTDGHR